MEETLFTAMEFLPLGKTETRYGDVWMAINIPTIHHIIVKERCLKLLVPVLQKAHMYYAYQSLQAFGMGRLAWGGEGEEVAWACEQALRGALAAGGKRKESLQLRLWNLNSTSNSPVASCQLSCQISANQREAERSLQM